MTTSSRGTTARIYDFPAKPRAATSYRNTRAEVAMLPGGFLPRVEFGSGWYHDEAIVEDRHQPVERRLERV